MPENFDPQKFQEAGVKAILASMMLVRPFVLGLKEYGDIEVKKHDDSLVTLVDSASEGVGIPILQTAFPDVPIICEESGVTRENPDSTWEMWMDGIDGTNAFTLGSSTPTIIICAYDRQKKQLVGCVVGEPSTGRIWSACTGLGCHLNIYEMSASVSNLLKTQTCRVWDGDFAGKTVLIDVSHGFTRGKGDNKRQILTDANINILFRNLQNKKIKVLILGSNGLNHALVANGNSGMVGCITTAMGGPWDTPTLLGIEAGGYGCGIRINNDRTLSETGILDPLSYDIAIAAGSQRALDFLSECVLNCVE
jgi:fructose-1,6-bisphosphatase/inositol monophosphatase family enzyme